MENEEFEKLYERVLENMTLYNQYQNNIDFDKAKLVGELIVKINDLAIKNGISKGDVVESLYNLEEKLRNEEKSSIALFD
jgi:predicted patatin/cPLA2 family phospholipase